MTGIIAQVQTGARDGCSDYVKVNVSDDGKNWRTGILSKETKSSHDSSGVWTYTDLGNASGN